MCNTYFDIGEFYDQLGQNNLALPYYSHAHRLKSNNNQIETRKKETLQKTTYGRFRLSDILEKRDGVELKGKLTTNLLKTGKYTRQLFQTSEYLSRLKDIAWFNNDSQPGIQIVFLHGQTGSGKSELARSFCFEHLHRYDSNKYESACVWWLRCEHINDMKDDLLALAKQTGTIESDQFLEQSLQRICTRLEELSHTDKNSSRSTKSVPWVIVCDNVVDWEPVEYLCKNVLNGIDPEKRNGTLIITSSTTCHEWKNHGSVSTVKKMGLIDCLNFYEGRSIKGFHFTNEHFSGTITNHSFKKNEQVTRIKESIPTAEGDNTTASSITTTFNSIRELTLSVNQTEETIKIRSERQESIIQKIFLNGDPISVDTLNSTYFLNNHNDLTKKDFEAACNKDRLISMNRNFEQSMNFFSVLYHQLTVKNLKDYGLNISEEDLNRFKDDILCCHVNLTELLSPLTLLLHCLSRINNFFDEFKSAVEKRGYFRDIKGSVYRDIAIQLAIEEVQNREKTEFPCYQFLVLCSYLNPDEIDPEFVSRCLSADNDSELLKNYLLDIGLIKEEEKTIDNSTKMVKRIYIHRSVQDVVRKHYSTSKSNQERALMIEQLFNGFLKNLSHRPDRESLETNLHFTSHLNTLFRRVLQHLDETQRSPSFVQESQKIGLQFSELFCKLADYYIPLSRCFTASGLIQRAKTCLESERLGWGPEINTLSLRKRLLNENHIFCPQNDSLFIQTLWVYSQVLTTFGQLSYQPKDNPEISRENGREALMKAHAILDGLTHSNKKGRFINFIRNPSNDNELAKAMPFNTEELREALYEVKFSLASLDFYSGRRNQDASYHARRSFTVRRDMLVDSAENDLRVLLSDINFKANKLNRGRCDFLLAQIYSYYKNFDLALQYLQSSEELRDVLTETTLSDTSAIRCSWTINNKYSQTPVRVIPFTQHNFAEYKKSRSIILFGSSLDVLENYKYSVTAIYKYTEACIQLSQYFNLPEDAATEESIELLFQSGQNFVNSIVNFYYHTVQTARSSQGSVEDPELDYQFDFRRANNPMVNGNEEERKYEAILERIHSEILILFKTREEDNDRACTILHREMPLAIIGLGLNAALNGKTNKAKEFFKISQDLFQRIFFNRAAVVQETKKAYNSLDNYYSDNTGRFFRKKPANKDLRLMLEDIWRKFSR